MVLPCKIVPERITGRKVYSTSRYTHAPRNRWRNIKFGERDSMAELIVTTKNKREEKVVKAFLDSLKISYTEANENAALYKAMIEGKKSGRLSPSLKEKFLEELKEAVSNVKLAKEGKLKAKPAKKLLN